MTLHQSLYNPSIANRCLPSWDNSLGLWFLLTPCKTLGKPKWQNVYKVSLIFWVCFCFVSFCFCSLLQPIFALRAQTDHLLFQSSPLDQIQNTYPQCRQKLEESQRICWQELNGHFQLEVGGLFPHSFFFWDVPEKEALKSREKLTLIHSSPTDMCFCLRTD